MNIRDYDSALRYLQAINDAPVDKALKHLSYWSIDLFLKCPQMFNVIIDQRKRIGIVDGRVSLEGKVAHLLVERYLLGRHKPSWMLENYETVFKESVLSEALIRWKLSEDEDKAQVLINLKQMVLWLVDYFSNIDLSQKEVIIEYSFNVKILDDLTIKGRPDIWLKDKVTKVNEIWDIKAVSKRSNVDDLQLLIYGLAVMGLTGKPVSSSRFVFPKLEGDLIRNFTDKDYYNTLMEIEEVWKRIKECRRLNKFIPRGARACKWCNVKSECGGFVLKVDRNDLIL